MYEKYAIALGHNPESPAFPFIVNGLADLAEYIMARKCDKKDPMYNQITAQGEIL